MIQANELRIGNAVQDDTGRIGIITELSKKSVRLKMGFSTLKIDTHHDEQGIDVNPIPLTPEILEKAGFEGNDGEYTHPDNTDFDLMITCSENGLWCAYNYGNIQNNSPFPETTLGYTVNPICNPFKYLHQLQNLYFALTQTELNIKL